MKTKSEYSFHFPSGILLEIMVGDITNMEVDAIVNAANSQLRHAGGLAAAIVRHGGETINTESREWIRKHGPVAHDQPAYTSGGHLPSCYVIHAVGPVWGEGDEDHRLEAAVLGSLNLGNKLNLKSIALPAISTGIFGFPVVRATKIFARTIVSYLAESRPITLSCIKIVLYDQQTCQVFIDAFNTILEQQGFNP